MNIGKCIQISRNFKYMKVGKSGKFTNLFSTKKNKNLRL